MKKYFALIFAGILCIMSAAPALAYEVSAECACVIEAQTGKILYEKNGDSQHAMASTTKVMTALMAIEKECLNDVVTVSANAAGQEGSSAYLRAGDQIRMEDLLYGLMLNSGNDAAVAVAEHIGGNCEEFAQMMTAKAKEIGAGNTSFKNPSGLDAEGHYTTAYDLALITSYALKNPVFSQIVGTKTKKITLVNSDNCLYFTNHNKMLSLYQGALGVKTGFTKATGRCLVSAAQRDGVTLVAVTLNAPDDWKDHTRMLDDGFSKLEPRTVVTKDQVLKTVRVDGIEYDFIASDEVVIPMEPSKGGNVSVILHMVENLQAPVNAGEKVGFAQIEWEENVVARVDVLSKSAIEKPVEIRVKNTFFRQFKDIAGRWLFGEL